MIAGVIRHGRRAGVFHCGGDRDQGRLFRGGGRRLARSIRDVRQVRRLLALAVILEGGSRSEAARVGYLLDGIDWRNPRHTSRPSAAG
jgi:hypothetical protein